MIMISEEHKTSSNLHKSPLRVSNTAIEFTVPEAVFLGCNPSDLTLQVVFLNQDMHLPDLADFFPII